MRTILSMNAFDPHHLDDLPSQVQEKTKLRFKHFGSGTLLFFHEPLQIEKGEGCYLIANDGTRYLDVYNNVPCTGHARPEVARAVYEQLLKVNTHTRYLTGIVDEYARRLLSCFPEELSNLTMTCTGSESNDLALREAFYFTGGRGIIITSGAYHGNSALVTEVSPSSFKEAKLPQWVETVSPPDSYRIGKDKVADVFCAKVEKAVHNFKQKGIKLAGILFDTIFSSDGVFSDPQSMIAPAVDLVHKEGGLLIADEVQPGFGRTGQMWGFMRHGVTPDIVTMGKPMGNGFPMAGVVTRPEILDTVYRKSGYFNTFGGSPAACAAGMAVLDIIKKEDLMHNAQTSGDYLRSKLKELQAFHPCLGDVRGCGLFTGLEIIKPGTDKEPDGDLATLIINCLREHKVLVGAAGAYGNTLKIRPPLCFGQAEADLFCSALKAALEDLDC